MRIVITDGGRKAAGFPTKARGDCVARSIAIASGRPYGEVYDRLTKGKLSQRASSRTSRPTSGAHNGVHVRRKWFRDYMAELGFTWVPTMGIGTGCKVHLRPSELPKGRLVVGVSKHYTAMIDGVVHDTHDPSRGGWRCVYGYWRLA
jgi:hypothetical protein